MSQELQKSIDKGLIKIKPIIPKRSPEEFAKDLINKITYGYQTHKYEPVNHSKRIL